MHTRRILPLLGLASALVFSGPAHSQTAGALQQASNGNPFAAMLEGKGTISSNINASISNNTFDIGDVAAIIEIVDDPHRRRGLRSKPFDAEGIEFPFPQQTLTFGEPVEVRSTS